MSHSNLLPAAFEDCLRRHNASGRRICVGLSGGVDSVVLLDLLAEVSAVWRLQLSAIHVHHGLSLNANKWASFCESLCAQRAIPLQVVAVNIDLAMAGGVESLARRARYLAFDEMDAEFIALAQHADDQAETVLHQILRGTGLKGMAGMGEWRPLRDGLTLIRPLLGVSRADIEAHAVARQLGWIDDESNSDMAYTRNFIRHALMPTLEERFPHYRESLARIGRHAAEADEMLSALAAIDLKWDGRDAFADLLDELPLTRQVNALYHWLHWQLDRGEQKHTFPSQAQLAEWAQQLFRAAFTDRPHQAGGHDFVILRSKNLLQLVRK